KEPCLRGLRPVPDTQKLKWRIWIASGDELLIGLLEADDTTNPSLLSYRYVVVPKRVQMAPRDPAETMVIERDVPITMDDGLVIRADVYRPKTKGPVPVIMTSGPYGKGVKYQEHYKLMWDWLVEQHPDVLAGSTKSFLAWETVDPAIWVACGTTAAAAFNRHGSMGGCSRHVPRLVPTRRHPLE